MKNEEEIITISSRRLMDPLRHMILRTLMGGVRWGERSGREGKSEGMMKGR